MAHLLGDLRLADHHAPRDYLASIGTNHPTSRPARAQAESRVQAALGGRFDYLGARSTLSRVALLHAPRADDSLVHDDYVTITTVAASDAIMARVRMLAESQRAATHHHVAMDGPVSVADARRAAAAVAVESASMIPVVSAAAAAAARRRRRPPSPTSLHAGGPGTGSKTLGFVATPLQLVPPDPDATTMTSGGGGGARARSPLRAPNKFYNVRVSQNPIFLRRTSIKPPHLASLPSPAPPLPPPLLAGPPSLAPSTAARIRSSPIRPRPPRPTKPVIVVPTVLPDLDPVQLPMSMRAVRTTTSAVQTPPPPLPMGTRVASVQADEARRDVRDSAAQSDPPRVSDRATMRSPEPAGVDRAVQAEFERPRVACTAVGTQANLSRPRPRTREVGTATWGLVRSATVATQTPAAPVPVPVMAPPALVPVAAVAEPVVVQVQQVQQSDLLAEVQAWMEQQIALRVVSADVMEEVMLNVLAELAVAELRAMLVDARTQADALVPVAVVPQPLPPPPPPQPVHISHAMIQSDAPAVADGGTQMTPASTPKTVRLEVAAQTSFESVPPPSPPPLLSPAPPPEAGEGLESLVPTPPVVEEDTTVTSITPIIPRPPPPSPPSVAHVAVQRTPSPSTPSESLPPTDPMTPTPSPSPSPSPTPPRAATPGESLPPPSIAAPSVLGTGATSPGRLVSASATTVVTSAGDDATTISPSMTTFLSEGQAAMVSEGELVVPVSGAAVAAVIDAVAPSFSPGRRRLHDDTGALSRTSSNRSGSEGDSSVVTASAAFVPGVPDELAVALAEAHRRQRARTRALHRLRAMSANPPPIGESSRFLDDSNAGNDAFMDRSEGAVMPMTADQSVGEMVLPAFMSSILSEGEVPARREIHF
ncbi:hypothetical protein BC828DRAFT_109484 [Blastocladiella britannica]|nr:hypothetical protein BC828DRAFT_109484 [Blastocladiella britannica]